MPSIRYIPNPMIKQEWEHSPDAWRAMGEVGDGVASLAREKAPVDTGRLAASIAAHPAPGPSGGAGVDILADVEYAQFVEFGTSLMAAQPFLRPALDEGV